MGTEVDARGSGRLAFCAVAPRVDFGIAPVVVKSDRFRVPGLGKGPLKFTSTAFSRFLSLEPFSLQRE